MRARRSSMTSDYDVPYDVPEDDATVEEHCPAADAARFPDWTGREASAYPGCKDSTGTPLSDRASRSRGACVSCSERDMPPRATRSTPPTAGMLGSSPGAGLLSSSPSAYGSSPMGSGADASSSMRA